ncbi:uncharacterized protein LOC134831244 isoform X2 [Culicoides brevitarsis]|uniref:uncharacterized protein LOC134831244 isoform X2 n=1 Tax=Culicoides brevitarsis TaxID=469753 RepID=UPI00307B2C97
MLISQIIFYSVVLFGVGFILSTCIKFLFEAARKFRRQDSNNAQDEQHRCNCSQPNENPNGLVYTISGRHLEPPPAFCDVVKDDKDLPKYEEVMEKPHLYRIEKESVVEHV